MCDAIMRLAVLAPTIGEADLRLLLYLTAAPANDDGTISASTRQIEASAGLARRNIQAAIRRLADRGLITCDGGSATRSCSFALSFLRTTVLPGRGVTATPPPLSQTSLFKKSVEKSGVIPTPPPLLGGVTATPEGGVTATPPLNEESSIYEPRSKEHAPAHGSESDYDKRINRTSDLYERIAKAKPESYDSDEIRNVRSLLCGYWRRMRTEPDALPPPDKLCAEMLTIASFPRIKQELDKLWQKRKKPDRSYRWFVTVLLEKIHGIEPATSGKALSDLRIVQKHYPKPEQQALLSDEEREQIIDLDAAFKSMAAGKAFR
jgi:hypothetical protein